MRNTLYSLVATTALSIALFSSAGTRPALAASDSHNQVTWGEMVSHSNGHDLLSTQRTMFLPIQQPLSKPVQFINQ